MKIFFKIRKLVISLFIFIFTISQSFAYVHHEHNECSYQMAWAKKYGGVIEYELNDGTRVDCLTDKYAIEFDFYNKWAEGIGQALHYGYKTKKIPRLILILENPKREMVYFNRVKRLANAYNFEVSYVTKDILNLDKYGRCSNLQCKCHKRNCK